MHYSIRRHRKKWGLFIITPITGEDGRLISLHKTSRAAEQALTRHWNKAHA